MGKIKKVLFEGEWLTGTLLPIMLGIGVFFLLSWLNGNFAISLFWGIFSGYMLFGGFIYISKSFSGVFETVNLYIGLAILLAGIIGLVVQSNIQLIGWPLLIAGIILALVAFCGWFAKKVDEGSLLLHKLLD